MATSERIHNRADRFNAAAPAGYTHTLDTGFILVESGLLRDCEKNVDVLFAALNENLNV